MLEASDAADAFDTLALMASPGTQAPSVDDLIRRSQCLHADDDDRELLALGANPDLLLTSQPDVWMAADRGGGDGGDSYDADLAAHQALRHLPTAVAARQPAAGSGQAMAFSASPASAAAVGAAATIDALLHSPCGITSMPAAHASDWLSAPAVFGNAVLHSAIPTPAQVLTAAAAGRGGGAAACGGTMAAMRLDQQLLAELPCISGPAALPSFWGGRTGMTTAAAAIETSRGGLLLLSGTSAAGGAFSSSATHGFPSSSAMLLQPPLLAQPTCMPQLPAQASGSLSFRPPQPQVQSGSGTDALQLAKEWRSGYDEFLMSEGGPAGDFLDWGGGCGAAMPPPPPPLQPYSGSNYSSAGSQQLQQSPWSTGGALQAAAVGNNSLTLLHTVGGRLVHMQHGSQRQGPAQTLSASGAVAAPGFASGVIRQAFCSSVNASASSMAVAEQLRARKQKHAHAPLVGSCPRVLTLLEPERAGIGASGTYVLGPDGEPPREYQRSLLQQPASASQLPRLSQPASPLQLPRLQHPQPAQLSQPLPLPLPQPAPLPQLPPPLRLPELKESAAWQQQAPAPPVTAEVGPAGTGDAHVVTKLGGRVATAVSQQAHTGVGAAQQLRLFEAMDVQQDEQEKAKEAEEEDTGMKEDPEPGAEKMAVPAGAAMGADSGEKSRSSRQGPRAAVGRKVAQAREKARAAVGWPLEEAGAVSVGCSSDGGGGNTQDDEDDGCCDTGAADDDDDDDDDGLAGSGRDGRVITVDDLRQYYEVPIKEAARRLGYSVSCLKNICRRLGVPNWPSRKLLTLQKMRGALLEVDTAANGIRTGGAGAASGQEAAEARLQRERLLERLALNIADIYSDPHTPMYPEFMRVRQLQYKSRANARLARRSSCGGRAGGGSISSSKAADNSRSGSKAADGNGSGGIEGGGRGEESRGRAAGGVAKRCARRDRGLRGICADTKEGSEVTEGSQDME